MGMYPCDVGNHRYVGAQQTIYAAVVNGGDAARRKLRLCPKHFENILIDLEARAQNAQMSLDGDDAAKCYVDHSEVTEGRAAFFATVYATRQDRRDFWAPLHDVCVPAACEDWQLPV